MAAQVLAPDVADLVRVIVSRTLGDAPTPPNDFPIAGDLVVHGGFAGPEGFSDERVRRELVTEPAVRAIVAAVAAAQARGDCGPLLALSFCHLEPAINGRLLVEVALPLVSSRIEDINFDFQPFSLAEARAVIAAVRDAGAHGRVAVSMVGCGVARADVAAGFAGAVVSEADVAVSDSLTVTFFDGGDGGGGGSGGGVAGATSGTS